MRKGIIFVCVLLMCMQLVQPTIAATPASITIDAHVLETTPDQPVRFSASVFDSGGSEISEPIIWTSSAGSIDSQGLFLPGEAGITTITAISGNVNASTNISVSHGYAVGISHSFNLTEVSIDHPVNLTASLVDRAGNSVPGDLIWRCQNGEIDHQNLTWQPSSVGNSTMRIIWNELEIQVVFNVVPGAVTSLEFPYGMIAQSGQLFQVDLIAKDALGNQVGISKAGSLTWWVEDGSITMGGSYMPSLPGMWNISVNSTSGASGMGTIRVLPAQATSLSIAMDVEQARAGSPIVISAIQTDILGNEGEVPVPLSNWTVPTGSLHMEGDSVVWTPTRIGDWVIGVSDQGFSSTLEVSVTQGVTSKLEIVFSEDVIRSGESIVASLSAVDAAGNHRSVNGAWTVSSELGGENQGGWYLLRPGMVGVYPISATWFDNETQEVHEVQTEVEIVAGELARIILPDSGTRVASDGILDLSPIFEDENGNIVEDVFVTWMVDGFDRTMEIRMADNGWAPSKLGMHEIRAMAQGVFAIIDVEVIPGTPRHITTNFEDGIVVASGESVELEISTLDVHGNSAPASQIEFQFDDPSGSVEASPKGDGHWIVYGGVVGEWNLRLIAGSATSDVSVSTTPGAPVRLIAELPQEDPEQGSTIVLRIHAIDQAGNTVDVPPSEVSISCTVGEATHIADDTYEVDVDISGNSQSCNVYWNGLVAQQFFDVEAVLFGGGLGDSNTALTLVSIIIFLFLAIMVVLIRRMGGDDRDQDSYWDDYDDYDDEDDDEFESSEEESSHEPVAAAEPEPQPEPEPVEEKEDPNVIRERLAAEARKTGVMQAAPGTVQGKTGWYIDSSGELTSWRVSESGEWTRVS